MCLHLVIVNVGCHVAVSFVVMPGYLLHVSCFVLLAIWYMSV